MFKEFKYSARISFLTKIDDGLCHLSNIMQGHRFSLDLLDAFMNYSKI